MSSAHALSTAAAPFQGNQGSLHGLKPLSPVPAINHAALELTKQLRATFRRLRSELPCEAIEPAEQSCRLVSLVPCGEIQVLRLSEFSAIPNWSLTAITAHDVLHQVHRITPRAEDTVYFCDLSERVRLTYLPNIVRSWLDAGHHTGIYAALSDRERLRLFEHYFKIHGHIPHLASVRPYLTEVIKTLMRTRRARAKPGR